MAVGFNDRLLLFGLGQRLDSPAFDLGLLENGGDQFALAPLDFRILHCDLPVLFDLVDLDCFGDHLLLHDVGLDLVGFVGLRLLLLHGFQVVGLA